MPQGAIEKWHEPRDESELLHEEPEPHDESEEAIQILVHDGAPASAQGTVRIFPPPMLEAAAHSVPGLSTKESD